MRAARMGSRRRLCRVAACAAEQRALVVRQAGQGRLAAAEADARRGAIEGEAKAYARQKYDVDPDAPGWRGLVMTRMCELSRGPFTLLPSVNLNAGAREVSSASAHIARTKPRTTCRRPRLSNSDEALSRTPTPANASQGKAPSWPFTGGRFRTLHTKAVAFNTFSRSRLCAIRRKSGQTTVATLGSSALT